MRYDPSIVAHTINACCVLHNIMVDIRITEEEEAQIQSVIMAERENSTGQEVIEEVLGESLRQRGVRSLDWLLNNI